MDREDKIIKERIAYLAGDDKTRYQVMTGVVISVEDDGSCTVQLTADDATAPSQGIVQNVKLNNTGGIYLVPAIGADCLVAEVDGPNGKMELLKASRYSEVMVTVGPTSLTVTDGALKIDNGTQPFVLGTALQNFMNTLIDQLAATSVPTLMGVMPILDAAQVSLLKLNTGDFLSQVASLNE